MRRLTLFVILTAVLVGTIGTWPVPVPVRMLSRESPVSRVAVIGDSYTTGTDEGGLGSKGWAARTWRTLWNQGQPVAADVVAEGRAGYGVRGDHGSIFQDLTGSAVRADDVLVVFFGSRNDQGVDAVTLATMAWNSFDLAHRKAPTAKLLVIGPPWPTVDAPAAVLQVRDAVRTAAQAAGAVFIDPIADRWFAGRPDLIGIDGVHPTDAGHAYLADKIAPLIRAELPRRN